MKIKMYKFCLFYALGLLIAAYVVCTISGCRATPPQAKEINGLTDENRAYLKQANKDLADMRKLYKKR